MAAGALQAIRTIARTLLPGSGRIYFRDYAEGDLAAARLHKVSYFQLSWQCTTQHGACRRSCVTHIVEMPGGAAWICRPLRALPIAAVLLLSGHN